MLLDKTWSGSSGSSCGAGSEGVEKIRCRTDVYIDKADAAEDLIEGHVVIGDPPNQRPYQGPVTINVLLLNKRGGSMGNLSLTLPPMKVVNLGKQLIYLPLTMLPPKSNKKVTWRYTQLEQKLLERRFPTP